MVPEPEERVRTMRDLKVPLAVAHLAPNGIGSTRQYAYLHEDISCRAVKLSNMRYGLISEGFGGRVMGEYGCELPRYQSD